MRAAFGIGFALAALAGATAARAGDFDGSRPLICANMQAVSCVAGEDCTRGLPSDIGAPSFIRIDFQQKAVIGPKRNSPILVMEKNESELLLQGQELGFGWTIALDQQSGEMSGSVVDRDGAIVLFGACTPQ